MNEWEMDVEEPTQTTLQLHMDNLLFINKKLFNKNVYTGFVISIFPISLAIPMAIMSFPGIGLSKKSD